MFLWTARATNSQVATPMEWRAAKRKEGAAAAAEAATTEAFFTTWDTVGKKCGILSSNVKTPHMIDYHGYLSNQNVSSFILRVIHMPIFVGI